MMLMTVKALRQILKGKKEKFRKIEYKLIRRNVDVVYSRKLKFQR